MVDIQKENEELLTPEGFARWVWRTFAGFPVTEPYDAEYQLLLNNAIRLDRAAFTKGLHEARRQYAEKPTCLIIAKTRLDEATNWHRFDKVHDDDSWCCQREKELRDEVMALEQ